MNSLKFHLKKNEEKVDVVVVVAENVKEKKREGQEDEGREEKMRHREQQQNLINNVFLEAGKLGGGHSATSQFLSGFFVCLCFFYYCK